MVLTEQEIKRIGEGNTGSWQDDLQFARAIESAVLEKLKAQEPVYFWLCDGCGHYYQECEYGQRPVSSCDCMTDASMFRKEFYPLPPADVVRDAERYKWLRERNWSDSPLCVVTKPYEAVKIGHYCPSHDRLDAAIDVAMEVMK